MAGEDILLSQKYGSLGYVANYSKRDNTIIRTDTTHSLAQSLLIKSGNVFRDIFLPYGYPDSVSRDYFEYQLWDTIQAFCSTITGTFTTQAVLKSVGVGNAEATPLAAAITWIIKDGSGMLGRIAFAWWKGCSLDADCKKWRLFADVLNDTAMVLELFVPYVSEYSVEVLCATTTMKAIVGVAGGATRASITNHQAIRGNMGDVSAKDGSQETCVNLVASMIGIILISVGNDAFYDWLIFIFFVIIHLYANYRAVKSLIFTDLNACRLNLLLESYLKSESVPNPEYINGKESVFLGFGYQVKSLCGFNIKLGSSLSNLTNILTGIELNELVDKYKYKNFLLIPNMKKKTINVALKPNSTTDDILTGYINAILLGITLCHYNEIGLQILYSKKHLHKITPIIRLQDLLKNIEKNPSGQIKNISSQYLGEIKEAFSQEANYFFTAIKLNGWTIDKHSMQLGEWRSEWNTTKNNYEKKEL